MENLWDSSLFKKDERLAEYIKIKDKYLNQSIEVGLSKEEKQIIKISQKNMKNTKTYII